MGSLLVIHCAEGGKKALERMAQSGHSLPGEIRLFELPCTGRVNEVLLMETLEDGVDGIMVVGCRKENCKYLDGNLYAEKKVTRIGRLLEDAGIDQKSVAMVCVAPDEERRLHRELMGFYEALRHTGVPARAGS